MYGVASALRIRYNTEYRTAKMGYKGEHLHGEQEKMLFIFNPFSGKAQIKSKLFEIIDVFVKGGYEVIVHPTQAVGDGFEKTKELAPQVDLVVCSGATEHWMKLSAV